MSVGKVVGSIWFGGHLLGSNESPLSHYLSEYTKTYFSLFDTGKRVCLCGKVYLYLVFPAWG